MKPVESMTDAELKAERRAMPHFCPPFTPEMQAFWDRDMALYQEQKRRYDDENAAFNQQVEKAGFKKGMRVSYFAPLVLGLGGVLIFGKVAMRNGRYCVNLERAHNGRKITRITSEWKAA